jgi:hypothetical protein
MMVGQCLLQLKWNIWNCYTHRYRGNSVLLPCWSWKCSAEIGSIFYGARSRIAGTAKSFISFCILFLLFCLFDDYWVEFSFRPTVSRPVRLGIGLPFGTHDQILSLSFPYRQSLCCSSCRAPSLMRGRVCNLQSNRWLVRSDPEVRVLFPALSDFLRSSGSGTWSITENALRLRYGPNRLMLSIGLWRWYINITVTILDIIHCSVFYLKLNSISLSVPHRKHITSPLRAQQVNAIYSFVASRVQAITWRRQLTHR